jgi:hypothetical protein
MGDDREHPTPEEPCECAEWDWRNANLDDRCPKCGRGAPECYPSVTDEP